MSMYRLYKGAMMKLQMVTFCSYVEVASFCTRPNWQQHVQYTFSVTQFTLQCLPILQLLRTDVGEMGM